jgi:predicted metal-dependent enzyme (double-stranded beta helix superfamily)
MKRFVLGLGIGVLLGLASVVVALAILLRASDSTAGAVAEPMLVFENDRVKAWSLTLEPGQSTPQHTHQLDEIVICLESSKLRIVKAGPEPEGQTVQPKVGEVFMPQVKGVTHVLTNSGETRYKQISIELK